MVLRIDNARSYKAKIPFVLHDDVVHQKKKTKINVSWAWKLPKNVKMETHKLPRGKKVKVKAGFRV